MKALLWFWAAVIVLAGGGAGFLQWHGAPAPKPVAAHVAGPASPAAAATGPAAAAVSPAATMLAIGGPIPPPDPALLQKSDAFPGGFLPRIGADHRTPATAYAAGADLTEPRPKVAILLAGIGMSAADSEQAVLALPASVSLAVSPYSIQPEPLLAEARQHGHELFLSIPMEPRAYPLDDPGSRALLTGNTPARNEQLLAWAMTRFGGYVGATGALGALHGERFADSPSQIGPVLDELARRGLLYIDPRPGATLPLGPTGRDVDVLIDQVPGAPEIDAALLRLEQVARAHGSAIGLVSVPRPVAVSRLVAWTAALKERGVALLPVSAIVRLPELAQQAGAQPVPGQPAIR